MLETCRNIQNQQLKSFEHLLAIIQTIGVCGLNKFRYVKIKLIKNNGSSYQYLQIAMQTEYFKSKFMNPLVLRLHNYYRKITFQLIQISTPQHIGKAILFLKKQKQAADLLYSNKDIKNLLAQPVQKVLANQKVKQFFHKQTTGFRLMLEKNDICNLSKLFYLIKRSQNLKMLGKEYQAYIDIKGNSISISDKISPDDQKMAKSNLQQALFNKFAKFIKALRRLQFKFQAKCHSTNYPQFRFSANLQQDQQTYQLLRILCWQLLKKRRRHQYKYINLKQNIKNIKIFQFLRCVFEALSETS